MVYSRLFSIVEEKVNENLPPSRPVRGILSLFFDDTYAFLHSKRLEEYQVQNKQESGCMFRTFLLGKPAVVVTDPNAMTEIFTQEYDHSMVTVVPPHHRGIEAEHAQFCSWMKPSLSSSKVSTHETTMELTIDNWLHEMSRRNVKSYVQAVPLVRALFLGLNLQIFLGTLSMDDSLMDLIETWSQSSVAHPFAIFPWRKSAKAKKARQQIFHQLVQIAKGDKDMKPVTLIGKLMRKMEQNQQTLKVEDVIDWMLTTIFVGADATASAAISMWKVLSLEPDVKENLQMHPDCIPTFVTNILQTYPPAPFGIRQVKKEMQVGDYTIPSDWFVVYGLAVALQDHGPEDWLRLDSNDAPWAFGGGPQRCPGRFLASQQLISFGRMLVHMNWQLKVRQNLKQEYNPGLFPVGGFFVRFPNKIPSRIRKYFSTDSFLSQLGN
jgi:cytochrome P450